MPIVTLGRTTSSILNLIVYQIGWFACVLGAASGRSTAGAVVAIALVLAHLLLTDQPAREGILVVSVAAIGLGAETLHARAGILEFSGEDGGALPPLWIVALWLQFGTVLHFCLAWLSKRYLLASVLGFVGGPLAFLGGERLGAAQFGDPRALSISLLGLSWALLLPILVAVADRLAGPSRYRLPRP